MSAEPLITVITPVKDARPYLEATRDSVLAQTWANWEWLICDNQSGDGSWDLLQTFNDPRIKLFSERTPGVSRTRNRCLKEAKGDFICMLDADDVLPVNSLKARADHLMANPTVDFCDGVVEYCNEDLSKVIRSWKPTFEGDPTTELLNIRYNCFFGNTWMIRRNDKARFDVDLRHSEDLMFFLSQSKGKHYSWVDEPVLKYRTGHFHAMSDSRGVEAGYRHLAAKLPSMGFSREEVDQFRSAAQRICFRSAVKDWRIIHALKLQVAGL
jgi:teichuronic acid biosynthesis glycosyltransferase TuaG